MSLYEAFVTVAPDMEGFPEEVKARVKLAADGATATAKVKIESDVSPRLTADIEAARAKVAALGAEYERTGKVDLRKNIADANSELNRLTATYAAVEKAATAAVRDRATESARASRTAADTLERDAKRATANVAADAERGLGAAFSRVGDSLGEAMASAGGKGTLALVGGIAVGVSLAAPAIGAGLAAAVGGTVVGGAVASGLALAFQSPRVKAEGAHMAAVIGGEMRQAATPFTQQVEAVIPYLQARFQTLRPLAARIFADLAPEVDHLAAGLAGGVENAVHGGGFEDLIKGAKPFLDLAAAEMPKIGADIDEMFTTISAHKQGALEFFKGMVDLVEVGITFFGHWVAGAEDIFAKMVSFDTKLVDTVLAAAKAISYISPAAAAAVPPLESASSALHGLADAGTEAPPKIDRTTTAILTAADAAKAFKDAASAVDTGLSNLVAAADSRAQVVTSFFGITGDRAEAADAATSSFLASQGDAVQQAADNARAVVEAQRSVVSASESLTSAKNGLAQASLTLAASQRGEIQAQKDLTRARLDAKQQLEDLRRSVRDLADNEEEARIRLARARQLEVQTSGLPTDNLARREAEVQLDEAKNNLADVLANANRTRAAAALAESKGVEGADSVVAARQRVADAHNSTENAAQGVVNATHGVRDAENSLADSHTTLTRAQAANVRTLDESTVAGRKNADAVRGQIDKAKEELTANLKNQMNWPDAWRIYQQRLQSIKNEEQELGFNSDAAQILIDKYGGLANYKQIDTLVNLIGAPEAATKIDNLFNSIKNFAGLFGVDLTAAAALKPGQPGFVGPVAKPHIDVNSPIIQQWFHRAGGGPVWGAGTETSDSIPTLLSTNEHVLSAAEVRGLGGHSNVQKIRNMAVGRYATGGPVLPQFRVNDHLDDQTDKLTAPAIAAIAAALASGVGMGTYTGPNKAGNSINEIVAAANRSNIPHTVTAESYDTPGYYHSRTGGYHDQHEAVDFGNWQYGQTANDRLAAWFAAVYGSRLRELIHTRADGNSGWYIKDGRMVPGSFYGRALMQEHINHVHVAALPGFSAGAGVSAAGITSIGGLVGALLSRIAASAGSSAPSSGDINVAATAYQTARALGADHKVLLSLFEAGIVESGFRNLAYGDRDSLGFLQQRPSQGWPSPMNVPIATRSFVSRAQANEGRYGSAGSLAQSVQRSAYPGRYDGVAGAAEALLNRVSGGVYDQGGRLYPGQAAVNLGHRPETVLDPDESEGLKAAVQQGPVELGETTVRRLVAGIVQAVQTRPHRTELDGRTVAESVLPHLEQALTAPGTAW